MFNNYYYVTKRAENCLSSFLQCLLCYIAPQFSLSVETSQVQPALYSSLLHCSLQLIWPRGASCWNNKSRSGLSGIFEGDQGRTDKMELSLGDIAAVVIYFLLILGIGFWVGRPQTKDLQPLLSCFSLWSDPTAEQWRAISWQGSTCSGSPLEPPSLPETLAASTLLVWQAQGLRQDSV